MSGDSEAPMETRRVIFRACSVLKSPAADFHYFLRGGLVVVVFRIRSAMLSSSDAVVLSA